MRFSLLMSAETNFLFTEKNILDTHEKLENSSLTYNLSVPSFYYPLFNRI
jgi:hypothetical protein